MSLLRILLVLLAVQPLGIIAAQEQEPVTLATVAGEPITDQDLVRYARSMPLLTAYLGAPGGPMRILDNMIKERLLILEGERLGIPRPSEAQGGESAYLLRVRKALMKPCPEPTEASARAYYQAYPEDFSTSLYLRLRRIGLVVTPETEAEVKQRLEQLRRRIESGEIGFAEAAEKVSQDPMGKGRGGDIGFVPDTDPDNPLMAMLRTAKEGEIVGPLRQQDMVYLYQVTDRREPILEPYATAKEHAPEKQRQACRQQALQEVFAELKKRWQVEVLVEDIAIWPEGDR